MVTELKQHHIDVLEPYGLLLEKIWERLSWSSTDELEELLEACEAVEDSITTWTRPLGLIGLLEPRIRRALRRAEIERLQYGDDENELCGDDLLGTVVLDVSYSI